MYGEVFILADLNNSEENMNDMNYSISFRGI